jgi:uncharacterized membrane protein
MRTLRGGSTPDERNPNSVDSVRAEHKRKATVLERIVDKFTGRVGRPGFVVLLTLIFVTWIGLNSVLLLLGNKPIDEPPFFWMQGAVSLAALYTTVLISLNGARMSWRAIMSISLWSWRSSVSGRLRKSSFF